MEGSSDLCGLMGDQVICFMELTPSSPSCAGTQAAGQGDGRACSRGPECRSHLRAGRALLPSPALSAAVPRRTPACASRRSDDPNDPDRLDARKLTRATLQTLIFGHIDALLPRCSVRFGATTSASLADQAGTRLHGAQPQ